MLLMTKVKKWTIGRERIDGGAEYGVEECKPGQCDIVRSLLEFFILTPESGIVYWQTRQSTDG